MSRNYIFLKKEIAADLFLINKEYQKIYFENTPRSTRLLKIYSRMALINLCGWVEDELKKLGNLSVENLKENRSRDLVNNHTAKIYGFDYDKHLSLRLILTFGVHGFEFIESKTGDANIAILDSVLAKLKKWRDLAAHSHANVIQCDPSRIILEFEKIFPILKKIEKSARKYSRKHF